MQTQQYDMIELNDDELSLVSGGLTFTFNGPVNGGFATGTGGNVHVTTTGEITANAGTGGFAAGFHTAGNVLVTT